MEGICRLVKEEESVSLLLYLLALTVMSPQHLFYRVSPWFQLLHWGLGRQCSAFKQGHWVMEVPESGGDYR